MHRPSFHSKHLRWLMLGVVGCGTQAAPLPMVREAVQSPPVLGEQFDPSTVGAIQGQVTWNGPLPESNSFQIAGVMPGATAAPFDAKNRLLPRIDPGSKGVAGAVLFLRTIASARSRPWDLPAVRVDMEDGFITVQQGDAQHVTGFVHRGDVISMLSRSRDVEMLRARGSAFFALAFPDPDKPLERKLEKPGMVELSSAAGNFWARSWLFVVDHPYYVHTDASGRFSLDQVPDGEYELVCWMPHWRVERFERDPETFGVARVWFRQPLEKKAAVRVERGKVSTTSFTVAAADFENK